MHFGGRRHLFKTRSSRCKVLFVLQAFLWLLWACGNLNEPIGSDADTTGSVENLVYASSVAGHGAYSSAAESLESSSVNVSFSSLETVPSDESLSLAKGASSECCSSSSLAELSFSSSKDDSSLIRFVSDPPKNIRLDFDENVPYTGIPRLIIETKDRQEILDRETPVQAEMQLWGGIATESEILPLVMHGRGNSTWGYPKKPFTIKLEEKNKMLGMAKAKKWVLLANYRDRTLIRNSLAFEISRRVGMEWTPNGRFVDVVLNGTFVGNYLLAEKIQLSNKRLNVASGSLLFVLDQKYKASSNFKTRYDQLPVTLYDMDEGDYDESSVVQLQSEMDSVECMLEGACEGNLQDLLDFESFARDWIVHELAQNDEPNHPKSLYMYKEPGMPIKAGPVWDFDWNTFTTKKGGLLLKKGLWMDRLSKNPDFVDVVQKTWMECRNSLGNMDSYIDSLVDYTKESNRRNIEIWPIEISSGIVGDEEKSLEEAVFMLKEAYRARLAELDLLFAEL